MERPGRLTVALVVAALVSSLASLCASVSCLLAVSEMRNTKWQVRLIDPKSDSYYPKDLPLLKMADEEAKKRFIFEEEKKP